MIDTAPRERRRHVRRDLRLSGRVMHLPSRQEFPCQCADASAGGARLLLPARVPVAVGHELHLSLPPAAELPAATARVVRVDRDSLLDAGGLTVGVSFLPT